MLRDKVDQVVKELDELKVMVKTLGDLKYSRTYRVVMYDKVLKKHSRIGRLLKK